MFLNSQIQKGYNLVPSTELEMHMPFDKDNLTFEQLDAILRYDSETGKLYWKTKTARKIVAGVEAGSNKSIRKNSSGVDVAYRYIRVLGKAMPAQRVAWLLHHGEWPLGKLMFRDNDPLNIKIDNLYMSNSLSTTHDCKTAEGRAGYQHEHRETFPLDWKDSYLQQKFDITLADYCRMVAAQDNKCGICGREETHTRAGKVKALAVDHDHSTGKIRGLLCAECNQMIGKAKENRETLLSAIRYLDKHSGRETVAPTLTIVPSEDKTQ